MTSLTLPQRYECVQERIVKALDAVGRSAQELTLVAVSKLHPVSSIVTLAGVGHTSFGENYVQEALEKQDYCTEQGLALQWHMIGHIQSRKAALVAGRFALIHTLDSEKLAHTLEKRVAETAQQQPVLIEVNIAQEPQKAGIAPESLEPLVASVLTSCPHLELQGLMCLPPVFDAGDAARPYFAQLYALRERLRASFGLPLPHLSMGMSGDFRAAIAEGATIVRIGTDIFGERPPKK